MSEPAAVEDEFLATVRERYKLCVDADRENRDRAREALAFRDLDQWDPKARDLRENDTEGARPCLVVDKTNQHVQQVVNDERQNRPQIKVRPGDGMAHPEVAKIYDGMMRQIQYRSHADIAYDTAFECAVDGGFGFWRLLTDYCDPMSFEQEIKIVRIRNRFSCYLDPARKEPDGSDANYGFLLYRVQKKDFKNEFGKKGEDALDSFAHEGREFTDWYGDDWVIYAEYFWKEISKQTIALLEVGKPGVPLEQVPPGVTPLDTRETEKCKIRWRKVTGTKILDDGAVVFDRIPIVEVVGNELDIEGKVKRSGMIRTAMDAQRVDNYATSAFIEEVALAPRASYVAAEGQVEGYEDDWRSANRRNISTLFYKPKSLDGTLIPPPQRVHPPGISQGWLSVLEQSEHNVQASMGRYNASVGAPSNEKSGRAILARQHEGDVGSFHFSDNLVRSLTFTGQMCVDALPKLCTNRQVVRMLGEDGEPSTAVIDPNLKDALGNPIPYAEEPQPDGSLQKVYNLSCGKYDVVVIAGPSFTTRRMEAADAMLEISRGNNEFLAQFGDIIFKSQDWPGADQISARFKKMLPPNLMEDDKAKDKEGELARKEAQIQAAVQALGQREAELQQAVAMIEEKTTETAEAEQRAKDAIAKVEKEIARLNEIQAGIENDKQLLALQKQLASKEAQIQSTTLQSEKEVAVAEAKVIEERLNAKLAEINDAQAAGEAKAKETASVSDGLAQAMQAIDEVRKLAMAPRRTTIEYDEHGEPVGAVSVPVIEMDNGSGATVQ